MDETTAAMSAKPTSRSKSEASDSEEEWTGFEEPPPLDQEQEYIDEDKYTTVTIESVGISRDGFQKSDPDALTEEEAKELEEKKKKWAKEKEDEDKAKAAKLEKLRLKKAAGRKKKFRYEAPAERKAERMKQRAKKSAKASKRKGE
ncbi:hypothetical protein P154DRAFT_528164 [Amniculicola lignicola CBS 123094]|uniref:Uncharacterized protein n=1 Tax=Amniculicola lignicola CBS 123094 TaxID=1392246 RepID=A0A6A5VW02_9PLEO|nr:hypothetical protein P154DRAFT_528164 [Amniculicola lignicola CBS 123094]